MVFLQRPLSFSSDAAKIHYVLGLLRGRALALAEAVSSSVNFSSLLFRDFKSRLKAVFDHPSHSGDASKRLLSLRQGSRSVANYSVDFWTPADAKWDDTALQAVFTEGLNEQLKDLLAMHDEPTKLHALISQAIKSSASVVSGNSSPPSARPTDEEPMQLGRTKLTQQEQQRRIRTGECLYCATLHR